MAGDQSKIEVVGSHYSVARRAEVHEKLLEGAKRGESGYVCISNVHTTMTGYFDPTYREITNRAFLAVPDGVPLVWAMRSLGAAGQDRVRGPSLMKDMLDQGRAHGIKHYLYGGSPTVLQKLQAAIAEKWPGAQIVGAESPPFKPLEMITDDELQAAADRINASGAQFVWIGLGAPKQERWIWRQRNSVKGFMFAIGAAFDLIPGVVPEAPAFLQAIGMEWAYRLAKEPQRLWRRYLFNNPAFLVLWAKQLALQVLGQDYIVRPR